MKLQKAYNFVSNFNMEIFASFALAASQQISFIQCCLKVQIILAQIIVLISVDVMFYVSRENTTNYLNAL